MASQQVGIRRCRDHGGVVSGKRAAWEKNADALRTRRDSKAISQFGVGGYAARDQDCAGAGFLSRFERPGHQVADDGGLEFGNHGERSRGAKWKQLGYFPAALLESFLAGFDFIGKFRMRADVIQDGGFNSAETEIVWVAFDLHRTK